jgi:hypothetical protein
MSPYNFVASNFAIVALKGLELKLRKVSKPRYFMLISKPCKIQEIN